MIDWKTESQPGLSKCLTQVVKKRRKEAAVEQTNMLASL